MITRLKNHNNSREGFNMYIAICWEFLPPAMCHGPILQVHQRISKIIAVRHTLYYIKLNIVLMSDRNEYNQSLSLDDKLPSYLLTSSTNSTAALLIS